MSSRSARSRHASSGAVSFIAGSWAFTTGAFFPDFDDRPMFIFSTVRPPVGGLIAAGKDTMGGGILHKECVVSRNVTLLDSQPEFPHVFPLSRKAPHTKPFSGSDFPCLRQSAFQSRISIGFKPIHSFFCPHLIYHKDLRRCSESLWVTLIFFIFNNLRF